MGQFVKLGRSRLKRDQIMNPFALGLITLGIILLLFGILFFTESKKTKGAIFSLMGIIAIAAPFIVSYFLAR